MESLTGYVDHIIFRNEENGYSVFTLENEDGEVTCVGTIPLLHEGELVEAEGKFVLHPTYGMQWQVEHLSVKTPEDEESIARYLGSGAIKGVGEKLAARIVKTFGQETFRIIEEEPERLAEIKGISERKAREIAAFMAEKRELRDAMLFLQQYGVTNRVALKIWKTYGARMYEVLRENPYQLAEDIYGIGFATADEIASRVGISTQSEFRIRSGILYTLSMTLSEGSSYLPREILLSRAAELLKVPDELIGLQLDNLAVERLVRIRRKGSEVQVYSNTAWREEQQIARMLADLESEPVRHGARDPEEVLAELEKEENLELDQLQREAVLMAADHAILIVSGGPGTGKTTTINTIIRYFRKENLEVLLAAPTGRAAKRMTEATGSEAMTIHRLLGVRAVREEGDDAFAPDPGFAGRGSGGSYSYFEKGIDNPLEADAIIIDEMSMVDMHLFCSLLKAVTPGTRLILVGDVNQLPSVGPGKVLQDLISSGVFRTVMLRKIFRQAMESDIVTNAHRILKGEMPQMSNKSRDFFFLERDSAPVIYKHTVELMRDKLPGYLHCDMGEIQVLTPMRKGPLGVIRLNEVLQSVLNPPAKNKREVQRQDVIFREGDKVMQTRNNYQIEWEIRGNYGLKIDSGTGVFNGDAGIIQSIDNDAEIVTVCFDEEKLVEYPFSELDDLEPAYAVTVHKSQGSEYPAVILPLLSGPSGLFSRNLLYTAVTRARDCVMILGSRQTVASMTANVRENRRYTGLKERKPEIHHRRR
ncbi:MAG: SF1B family DNA helicase RecD2 [Lachnospiraceae bacterium]